ncbi:MAG TPA: hypothetical protein VGM88_34560 [Kofleriaceae bacterium]|jgi:hypothetical protein
MGLLAATQLGATHCGEITNDAGFDVWCGTSLCSWELERGNIDDVPTWNDGDRAVLLWGNTAIDQFAPVTWQDGTCIEFDVLANVASGDAVVNVDLYGDGSVEESIPIPDSDWAPLTYYFSIKAPFSGIKIELATTGEGSEATFARMSASIADASHCVGLQQLDGGPAPDGAFCEINDSGTPLDSECASGYCFAYNGVAICGGCDPSIASSCPSDPTAFYCVPGDVVTRMVGPVYGCEQDGDRALGARCDADSECAGHVCSLDGWCSACNGDSDCATGTCTEGFADTVGGPQICGVRSGTVASGKPCAENEDCASGICDGTVTNRCDNSGRRCNNNADCVGVDDSAGFCVTVGVEGGSCQ